MVGGALPGTLPGYIGFNCSDPLIIGPQIDVVDFLQRPCRTVPRGTSAVAETQTVTIFGEAEGKAC